MAAGVKSFSKIFVWILMGLLLLGLAGFGAVNLSGTVRTVATVGDETVSVDEYARELQREIRAVEAQTGQPLPMSQAREIGIDRRVLTRLVALAAVDNEVGQLGVSIGDENLQREILEISAFQGADGGFDRESYRFALEQAGLNEAEFEADLRKETARTLVQGAIVGGVQMPETLTDTLADFVAARRSFTAAIVTPDKLETLVPPPSDAQLTKYYEANPDQFTLLRTKKLTYALLTPAMLLDEVEIDEDSVRRLYEQRENQYNQPERRLVERLIFSDERAAEDALAQIEVGGTTFENLVDERGLALSDIDMGDVAAGDLGEAAGPVFEADVGEVVGPLATDLGPALFRVNGSFDARTTSFEDVEAELRDELAASRARRLIEARAENIDDLLAGGATLEELAQETDLELGQIDWTPETSDGVAAYAEFRSAAQAVKAEDFPEVQFLEDGAIFALRLDEELPPRPEPFESARDKVVEAWTAQAITDALEARADDVLAEIEAGGDLQEAGLQIKVENGLTRTAFLDYAPDGFMGEVFDMEVGDWRVVSGDGNALLVRLDEILPPAETDELTQMRQAMADRMDQALAQNLFDAFVQAARARAELTIDQQALTAVQANFQ
ncbi:peptidyl-prolyl cis-trans isomerase D [Cribrihabitans marinus]|uniref:Peptidyl-prolyl cis-trans isomerase D n=1 Tax=Cribrihabitans marinus TaxID=1227549 RepID=A0A1H7DTF7_9RHOB|nr:peptidyl-prolyl cis-trans isomerase [Cribrihabitans marinus]GGH40419.1 peptidyl-prolyl cis-trans isomerase [Cribrihabitans marinus]SEK05023.1 peptidyl-prolyl cis-trans isomerase D [Cribrihabitans marinus]